MSFRNTCLSFFGLSFRNLQKSLVKDDDSPACRQDDGAASATRGVWSLTHHKTMNGIMVNGKGVEKESSVDLSGLVCIQLNYFLLTFSQYRC